MTGKIILNNKNILIAKVYALITFFIHTFLFFIYCEGFALFFNKNVNIFQSFRFIINLIKSDQLFGYYRIWFGMAIGVLYIFLFVYNFIKFIRSFTLFKKLIFHKISIEKLKFENETLESKLFSMGENVGKTFISMITFSSLCSLLKNFDFSAKIYIIIALGITNYIITRLVNALINEYKPLGILEQMSYLTIYVFSFILLFLKLVKEPAIETFLQSIMDTFKIDEVNVILLSVSNMLTSLIFIIFVIIALITFNTSNDYVGLKNTEMQKLASSSIIIVIVLVVIEAVYYLNLDPKSNMLESVFAACEQHFSLLCLTLSITLITYTQAKFKNYETTQQSICEIGFLDDNGALYIHEDVNKITEEFFQDYSNITSIFIPDNVLIIEKNAFYGCGGLTGIYCSAKGKPQGWDIEWNNGCYATVHWDYKFNSPIANSAIINNIEK